MSNLGWVLSNNEQGDIVIQKNDESKRFKNDDEATEFVVKSYKELLKACREAKEQLEITQRADFNEADKHITEEIIESLGDYINFIERG